MNLLRLVPCNASCGGACEKPERYQSSIAPATHCWLVWCKWLTPRIVRPVVLAPPLDCIVESFDPFHPCLDTCASLAHTAQIPCRAAYILFGSYGHLSVGTCRQRQIHGCSFQAVSFPGNHCFRSRPFSGVFLFQSIGPAGCRLRRVIPEGSDHGGLPRTRPTPGSPYRRCPRSDRCLGSSPGDVERRSDGLPRPQWRVVSSSRRAAGCGDRNLRGMFAHRRASTLHRCRGRSPGRCRGLPQPGYTVNCRLAHSVHARNQRNFSDLFHAPGSLH